MLHGDVLGQRSAFFDRMPVGRLLTRMTNDVESINEMFASGVITLVADVVKLIAIVVTMLVLDVQLTLMTFLVLPLVIILSAAVGSVVGATFNLWRDPPGRDCAWKSITRFSGDGTPKGSACSSGLLLEDDHQDFYASTRSGW